MLTGKTRFVTWTEVFSGKCWLVNPDDSAVANYIGGMNTHAITYFMRAGNDLDHKERFQIYATYNYARYKTYAQVVFADAVTAERCEVGFEGDWFRRNAIFWLYRTPTRIREPIARVYNGTSRRNYCIDVAPNVDIVLIVMMCDVFERLQYAVTDAMAGK